MGWETCRGKRYFVISKQVNGVRTRKFASHGEASIRAEQEWLRFHAEARQEKADAKTLDRVFSEYDDLIRIATNDELLRLGFVQRYRNWKLLKRKKFEAVPLIEDREELRRQIEETQREIQTRLRAFATKVAEFNIEPSLDLLECSKEFASCGNEIEMLMANEVVCCQMHSALSALRVQKIEDFDDRVSAPCFWDRLHHRAQGRLLKAIRRLARFQSLHTKIARKDEVVIQVLRE